VSGGGWGLEERLPSRPYSLWPVWIPFPYNFGDCSHLFPPRSRTLGPFPVRFQLAPSFSLLGSLGALSFRLVFRSVAFPLFSGLPVLVSQAGGWSRRYACRTE